MPLYLVRWPTLVCSIVRADDEEHLTDLLDEVASPEDAVWTEYNGPLWFDVTLGISATHQGDHWEVEGAEDAAREPLLGAAVESEDCETTDEMFNTILSKAFPHLYRLIDDVDPEADEEPNLDPAAVRSAALMDLWLHRGSGDLPDGLKEIFKRGGKPSPEE